MNKRLLPLLLGAGVLCIIVGIYLAIRPRTSPQLEVLASTPWTSTGVVVQSGKTLVVNASGSVVWKNIAKTNPNAYPTSYEECGPQGTPPVDTADYYSNINQYQCAKCSKGALIGKIGNGVPFMIGSSYSGVSNDSGELLLGINEMRPEIDRTSYADNAGKFTVTVEVR